MPTTNRVSAVTPGRMIMGTTRAPRRVAARVDTKASTNVRPLYLRRAGAEEAVTDACSLRGLPQCLAPHGCLTLKPSHLLDVDSKVDSRLDSKVIVRPVICIRVVQGAVRCGGAKPSRCQTERRRRQGYQSRSRRVAGPVGDSACDGSYRRRPTSWVKVRTPKTIWT